MHILIVKFCISGCFQMKRLQSSKPDLKISGTKKQNIK